MLKRFIDIIASVIGLLLLAPVIGIVAFHIQRKLGSPVFFTQVRAGQRGASFKMVKFRSMTDERDAEGNLLVDKQRLTRFGKLLRSTSLDELPSLWNVQKGEMSLVGPRPLLMEYLEYYSDDQARRMEIKPGVTGWAQVNGRNAISWEQKFQYDVWYVDHQSLWLDVKIIWLTVKKVLVRDGISPQDEVIMPRFDTMMIKQKSADEK